MSREHILVVEDDIAILTGLRTKLEIEDYRVSEATDGEAARQWLEMAAPDLLVLDIMLPGLDGLSLLRCFRRKDQSTPVLILSARGREEQRIEGLKAGADDYLPKPFGLGELLARIEALLRRQRHAAPILTAGPVTIDFEALRVSRDSGEIALSKKELDILMFLARRPRQVIERDVIFASVWGDLSISDTRAVDYHILNLRKKLERDPKQPELIVTRHGRGYEFLA